MQKRFIFVAYLLFLVPLAFILNFLFDIITLEKVQGFPVFFPLLCCPIGLFFASQAHKIKKSILTYGAFLTNSKLFVFPFAYMILGTVIWGPK